VKIILFPLCYVLIVISLITYAGYYCNYPEKSQPENVIKSQLSQKLNEEIKPEEVFNSSYINLAFLGLDKTEERVKTIGCFRTDTIIIMHIDLRQRQVYMLSVPRDTYVYIPVINRMDKINHAFPYGGGEKGKGFASTIATLENFLGIKIDHYVGMDMEAIEPLVDAVGGVELQVDLDYDQPGCHLVKGMTQMLDGKMAYHYVHFRNTGRGDIDRIERQMKFLKAFLKTAKQNMNVQDCMAIYREVRPSFYTSLSYKEILSLVYYFKKLDSDAIDSSFLKGDFMNLDGISYWNPNKMVKDAIIKEKFLIK
jgi:LCP family protein required for cell wall assembly